MHFDIWDCAGLTGKFVLEVSCGHGDAHTLIRLADGIAMSFSDTDHEARPMFAY